MIFIDSERCTGCGECVEVCPEGAIRLIDGVANLDLDECQECDVCLDACSEGAILAVSEPPVEVDVVPAGSKPDLPVLRTAEVPAVRPVARVLPWLGAALTFVGREVVPRVAETMLEAWDRRRGRSVRASGSANSTRRGRSSASKDKRGSGQQRRRRRRGNR